MLISDLSLFNQFADKVGNRYIATSYIAHAARKFSTELPRYIIESYLIHWVLVGEDPKHIKASIRDDADTRYMNEILCYVCDQEVVSAVREMYSMSVKARHLVYESNMNLNANQLDRAKILLRMIWYQFED